MSTRSKSYALTQFRIPCPERASHTSPGCQPWEPTRQHSSRSEGTPHNLRVSDIEHETPSAVFLQNTPNLSDAGPRALPWAGMRCPFRANGTITFPIQWAPTPFPYRSPHRVPDTLSPPYSRYRTPTTFPIPCPEGASHTSPGCQPWEPTRQHSSRSEGTPHNLRVSDIEHETPSAVFLQNINSFQP